MLSVLTPRHPRSEPVSERTKPAVDVTNTSFAACPHDDVLAALRQEPEAWANFQRYPAAYRRIRLAYVGEARGRPEEFAKRLRHLLRMTARNRRFGYGIERFFED